MPPQGQIVLEVRAPEFGSPSVEWQLNKSVTIRLDRAGSVTGLLSGPPGTTVAGQKVTLSQSGTSPDFTTDYRLSWQGETRTERDGVFRFPAVAATKYRVHIASDAKADYAVPDSPTSQ